MNKIFKSQLIIPIGAMFLLILFNLIVNPAFFLITPGVNSLGNPVLLGNIITILSNGSELAILAIGMALVTAASGGQDISVGATMAIAGSVIFKILCGGDIANKTIQNPVIVAFLAALVVAMIAGAFNGALVAYFNIPPMVATLILYTAGRSIAAWINFNKLPHIDDIRFITFGTYIPGIPIPTPFFIAVICVVLAMLMLKFTTLGTYVQAVGINEKSSRLNGINPKLMKFITFVILGACVAVAALVRASRLGEINYSGFAKDIEMDAILAVALGGNSLGGGKFNLLSAVLGAYIIQFLTTTLLTMSVPSEALPAYKAVVVIILVVISSPTVKEKFTALKNKMKSGKKEVA